MASLKLLTERAGERVLLDKTKTIFGRHHSCDCQLPGKTVSREHFAIELNNGRFFLVDLESINGTFANGERVSWVELKDGDTIRAGPYTLLFEEAGEPGPADDSAIENQTLPDSRTSDAKQRSFKAEHELLYPRQYLEGIEHFNTRRYFDAHEVWEEIWLHASDETKLFYQMLIQAAVGLHHYERGNMSGARGMFNNVISKLQQLPATYMSIDLIEFARQFKSFFDEVSEHEGEVAGGVEKQRPVIDLLDTDADTDEHRTQWE
jgi:predicted metal-dependent hydrolase